MDSATREAGEYLRPGTFIDSDHPRVMEFSQRVAGQTAGDREKAVALYYAVRDEFRYDPYRIDLNPEAMKASALLARGYGFCIAKAVLLAAACRAQGIPARLGFADVRNHLTTPRLRRSMGTDVFVYHGFAELLLQGSWVKATPAFNRSLCERFGVTPLEFDGVLDSVFQPFDAEGQQYMEYLRDHGRHADLPLEDLRRAFEKAYPRLMSDGVCDLSGRFEEDAEAERRRKRAP
jgi:transglutaminase-like putative cysteine protease